MSRAFVKEPDGSEPFEVTERQISTDWNFVTESGLKLIESEIKKLKKQLDLSEVKADEMQLAQLSRDLRYWLARRTSAELVVPAESSEQVVFGTQVTVKSAKDKKTFRIVGQDEADPAAGLVSYTSPIARMLIGKRLGDEVVISDNNYEIIRLFV